MIAPETHPVWARWIKGEVKHQFKRAAASMLSFNLQEQYKKNPESLPELIAEARQFFAKYEAVFAADLSDLFR